MRLIDFDEIVRGSQSDQRADAWRRFARELLTGLGYRADSNADPDDVTESELVVLDPPADGALNQAKKWLVNCRHFGDPPEFLIDDISTLAIQNECDGVIEFCAANGLEINTVAVDFGNRFEFQIETRTLDQSIIENYLLYSGLDSAQRILAKFFPDSLENWRRSQAESPVVAEPVTVLFVVDRRLERFNIGQFVDEFNLLAGRVATDSEGLVRVVSAINSGAIHLTVKLSLEVSAQLLLPFVEQGLRSLGVASWQLAGGGSWQDAIDEFHFPSGNILLEDGHATPERSDSTRDDSNISDPFVAAMVRELRAAAAFFPVQISKTRLAGTLAIDFSELSLQQIIDRIKDAVSSESWFHDGFNKIGLAQGIAP